MAVATVPVKASYREVNNFTQKCLHCLFPAQSVPYIRVAKKPVCRNPCRVVVFINAFHVVQVSI